jgi:hypothetical protein
VIKKTGEKWLPSPDRQRRRPLKKKESDPADVVQKKKARNTTGMYTDR